MDGSTDSSNAENEIFMVVTCDTKSSDEMVHTIDCWWNDKQRRPNQQKRNPCSSGTSTSASSTVNDSTNTNSDIAEDLLSEWDDCFTFSS